MKALKLKFYSDPGHGWLAVPMHFIERLNLLGVKFSAYSYQSDSGETVYLEEDCDMPLFLRSLPKLGEYQVSFLGKTSNRSSRIRNLGRLSC